MGTTMSEREIFVEELDDTPEAEVRAPRTARGAALIGARVFAGVVGLVVAGVAIGGASLVALPSHSVTPLSTVVTPVPAAQQRVCAGPVLKLGDESGKSATAITSIGQPSVVHAQSAGTTAVAPLSSTDSKTGVTPESLTLPPSAAHPDAALQGSQSELVASGDTVGFSASECAEGSSDSWLVGGATDTGRTTLVTLSNPSSVIATVTLTVYGESGAIVAAGTAGVVVPGRSQRVLSLSGFAPDVLSPVIHVQSVGGLIVANLQQSIVRTLAAGGVDTIGTSQSPSTLNLVPGIILADGASVSALQPQPGFSDLRTIIRVFVPGSVAARTEISIIPEDGSAALTPVRVIVQPGVVTDVPLDSYPDGSYTVMIASDKPVVTAARVSTVGSTGQSDFTWIPSAQPIATSALIAVAPGPSPQLNIANPTRKSITATLRQTGGPDLKLVVPAGGAVSQAVTGGSVYSVTGFDSLDFAVSYLGDGQLASFAVTPSAPASRPIRIYPSR